MHAGFLLELAVKHFFFNLSFTSTCHNSICRAPPLCISQIRTNLWSFCRYLIFFCPMNLFYKCVSFLPVKLIFVAMKEVVRVRKIAAGVHHAHHLYHHGWFVMMATGWVKGDT